MGLRRQAYAVDQAVDRLSHIIALGVGATIGMLLYYKVHVLEKREPQTPLSRQAAESVPARRDERENYDITVSRPIGEQSRPQPQLKSQPELLKWEGRKGW